MHKGTKQGLKSGMIYILLCVILPMLIMLSGSVDLMGFCIIGLGVMMIVRPDLCLQFVKFTSRFNGTRVNRHHPMRMRWYTLINGTLIIIGGIILLLA